MSLARRIKRGRAKIVLLETLRKFVQYRLSNRGQWIMINNDSAPHLSKYQMNKLINKNNKNG